MPRSSSVSAPSPAADPRAFVKRADAERDTTPPDDHDGFLELQARALAALKKFAAKRRVRSA